MTTLPPQAYTREMLSTAYSWLLSQPESIRNLAQTPDALVGLYLRAKKTGEASLESVAPVSREVFRQDLKNLAAELQQFETTERPADVTLRAPAPRPSSGLTQNVPNVASAPSLTQPSASFHQPSPSQQTGFAHQSHLSHQASHPAHQPQIGHQQNQQPVQTVGQMPSSTGMASGYQVDEKSRGMIRDVMVRLNLSSESEALRALISLGYDRLKGVLPPV